MQQCPHLKGLKMGNVLITSAGKRVSLVKAFEKELNIYFPNSKVYTADSNPLLAVACSISYKSFQVPKLNNINYINTIIELCKENQIRLIIPTIDTELLLLAENEDKFLSENIIPVLSSKDFIKKCRNKRKIHSFFVENNIDIAREYEKNKFSLPLFIKPLDGSRSVDNYIIKTEKDFMKSHFLNDNLIFLEYLENDKYQEYTCDLYYGRDNHLKCVVPRKRIEVRDGEVTKSKTEKNFLVNFINEKLKIIKGARGCLTAQFFLHKYTSNVIGIEINPRFGGGYPLSYEAGANYPKWIIEEYLLDNIIEPYNTWEDNLLMLRYHKEVYVKNTDA